MLVLNSSILQNCNLLNKNRRQTWETNMLYIIRFKDWVSNVSYKKTFVCIQNKKDGVQAPVPPSCHGWALTLHVLEMLYHG